MHGAQAYLRRLDSPSSSSSSNGGGRGGKRSSVGGDQFDAIWLPDADIAFSADELSAFLLRWSCAFEDGPPLVAQPAMHHDLGRTGRSQQFWHLNYGREWQPLGRLAGLGTHAMHTAFVEQQAPLLDVGFFRWFVKHIGRELAMLQSAHSTDVATDQLWCRAAAHYARSELLAPRAAPLRTTERAATILDALSPHTPNVPLDAPSSFTDPWKNPGVPPGGRVGCAVIPVPFRHRGVQRRRSPAFWRGVNTVREAAEATWPNYWLSTSLLRLHRLSSEHVEVSKSLGADRCMVRSVSSTRLGPAC